MMCFSLSCPSIKYFFDETFPKKIRKQKEKKGEENILFDVASAVGLVLPYIFSLGASSSCASIIFHFR